MALQHLRSSTADKRPTPGAMSDGQLALNTNLVSPGLFFKDSNGDSVKIGPIHVGATAPNATPGAGGQAGNSKGEAWLDTSATNPILKVWNGSAFVAVQPVGSGTVVSTADTGTVTSTMILDGTILNADVNASAAIAGTKINPDFGSQTIATTGEVRVANINGGPLAGFRNAIINGNFDFWHRGTSFSANDYGADRWINARNGSACTMSRQAFTPGQTSVPGEPTYFCRMAVTSSAGASNYVFLSQRIEDVRTFAGQQVTVSFWVKADATKSIAVEIEQYFGTGGSPSAGVALALAKVSIGTAFQKVTVTATLPSISGKTLGSDGNHQVGVNIWLDAGSDYNGRTDSLGQQSGTFDIAQVQIERGPVATPFERRPIGTELSLCQRYFQALGPLDSLTSGSLICVMPRADLGGTNENNGMVELKVSMRAAPTVSGSGWQLAGHHNSTPTISTGTQFVVFTYSGADYRASGGRLFATNAQASAEL